MSPIPFLHLIVLMLILLQVALPVGFIVWAIRDHRQATVEMNMLIDRLERQRDQLSRVR